MKHLKRIAAVMIACLLLTLTVVPVMAADETTIYVSIANGEIMLANAPVTLTDYDNDGELTINDALACAHVQYFNDGAEGYGSATTEYGLSLTKLWGVENGGSYGYYVNNASANSLSDKVNAGDAIYAFIYTDTTAWSDTFCYFDKTVVEAAPGETIELTLCEVGFDLDWKTISIPIEGATVTVDGVPANALTDADGKITITISTAGTHTISASKDNRNLVPPVCTVNVSAPTNTGDDEAVILVSAAVLSMALAAAVVTGRRKASC